MGLAISLVGGAKEKVWFHKCPTRGKGCTNRRLVSEGGCTLWYDEQALWKTIAQKISNAQSSLVRLAVAGGYKVPGDMSIYGRKAAGKSTAVGHSELLRGSVAQVAALEALAQTGYWDLYQFRKGLK